MGPQATIVRSGLRALGPTLYGLTTPCGEVLSLSHPYLRVCERLRRIALFQWRRFEPLRGDVLFMCVEGEKPFSTHLGSLGV
jgi:hypothetical protein